MPKATQPAEHRVGVLLEIALGHYCLPCPTMLWRLPAVPLPVGTEAAELRLLVRGEGGGAGLPPSHPLKGRIQR